jgi:hypothetical protein
VGVSAAVLDAAVMRPLLSTVMLAAVYEPAVTAVLARVVEPSPTLITSPVWFGWMYRAVDTVTVATRPVWVTVALMLEVWWSWRG